MNLITGTHASSREDRLPLLTAAIEGLYHAPPSAERHGSTGIASLDDGGVVLGRAQGPESSLLLLGGLHHPLAGWTEPSRPGDDPDRAAAWLLERFLARDAEFLDGVRGQLAVLVADHAKDRLLAASDGSGLRSLFVHEDDERGPTVSSNLFLLARALRGRVRPDRSLEDFFLVYGYLPWGRTVFKGIRTLPPGTLHIWKGGELRTRPITTGDPWAGRFPPLEPGAASEDEILDRLYEAFMVATEEQTASDGRVGVLLGGVDSALVASALHRLGKEVETFSFHYDEPGFDQPHTDTLSQFLGIRHHWVRINPEIMEEGLERYGLMFSRPTNWPNYVIQTAHVCEVMRDHGILRVHSGDGCDSVFLGYPRTHTMSRFYQVVPRLPRPVAKLLISLLNHRGLESMLGRPFRVAMNILRNLARPMPQRGFLSFRVFDESSLSRLRADPPPPQELDIEVMLKRLTRDLGHLSADRLAYRGKAGVSANKAKLGGSSDHTGVIVYAPYLHPGLKRFASDLPERLLRPESDPDTAVTGKYILLRMAKAKELLPPSVIYQPKVSGVDAPVDRWYTGALAGAMRGLLQHLPFDTDEAYLEDLLRPTRAARFYARHISSDDLTTHEASLLATYAALVRALH